MYGAMRAAADRTSSMVTSRSFHSLIGGSGFAAAAAIPCVPVTCCSTRRCPLARRCRP